MNSFVRVASRCTGAVRGNLTAVVAGGANMADRISSIDSCRTRYTRKRRVRLRAMVAGLACSLAASMLVVSTGGCTAFAGLSISLDYNECCDEFVLGYRNSAWSARAWHERKHCFQNEDHRYHFRDGFRQGYEDVASGGNGCTPAFPPRSYWSWKFQSPEGQQRVNAWFAGYPHGARAAEEDGLGNYGQIQMSAQMAAACQSCGMGEPAYVDSTKPAEAAEPTPSQVTGYEGLLGEGETIVGDVQLGLERPANQPAPAVRTASPRIGSGIGGPIQRPQPF